MEVVRNRVVHLGICWSVTSALGNVMDTDYLIHERVYNLEQGQSICAELWQRRPALMSPDFVL